MVPDIPSILVVNHNQQNLQLLNTFLQKAGYYVLPVNSLVGFDQALHGDMPIRLALLDISGFDLEIWGRCEILRDGGIPFFLISPRQELSIQVASVKYGAKGVMIKPLEAKKMLDIIHSLL